METELSERIKSIKSDLEAQLTFKVELIRTDLESQLTFESMDWDYFIEIAEKAKSLEKHILECRQGKG